MPAKRDVETREVLAAVVLADSFTHSFRPVTLERPKVLIPLVNTPLIDYTLEWLASNNVEEVYVVACAHAEQIQKYLNASSWTKQRGFKVHIVVSTNCRSAGEALRLIDQKDVIKSNFILVSGDVVANLNIQPALQQHRTRRESDPNSIMTLLMKPAAHADHARRLGDHALMVAVDPISQRLLSYVQHGPASRHNSHGVKIDADLFGERDAIQMRTDLLDTHICICAPEVLVLFSDNFDFQNIRRDFVSGVLSEEELGNKLHVYIIQHDYAARVHNPRSYDAVSRDVLQRWLFPLCPDTGLLPSPTITASSQLPYARQHIYRDVNASIARSARIGHDTVIGPFCSIGEESEITACVLGKNCRIGKNVTMKHSYLLDDVRVEDGAILTSALVCSQAHIKADAQLLPGAVISYKVVVGAGHKVAQHLRISLCQQAETTSSLSDDELEYAAAGSTARSQTSQPSRAKAPADMGTEDDGFSGSSDDDGTQYEPANGSTLEKPQPEVLAAARAVSARDERRTEGNMFDAEVVGNDGAGFLWMPRGSDEREVGRVSLAELRAEAQDDASSSGGSAISAADVAELTDSVMQEEPSWEVQFKQEVQETFLRGVQQQLEHHLAHMELNNLKIAEDKSFADIARYIFTTILSLALPARANTKAEYRSMYPASLPNVSNADGREELAKRVHKNLSRHKGLLGNFLRDLEDQVEVINTFEDFAGPDPSIEFADDAGHHFAQASVFAKVLQSLYDLDVVAEEAILQWADEKGTDAADQAFVKKAQPFITWLKEAEAESSDDESDDDSASDAS
ncbi:hypothetical protein WJX74_004422 [Apatococcus lobatus]|uniref:Translation initiation factor eIF2B subunit epsilon n=1 Tax=Apatococcus lobatus TaxID=904363 RepID=A0AAW1S601_9CHLO